MNSLLFIHHGFYLHAKVRRARIIEIWTFLKSQSQNHSIALLQYEYIILSLFPLSIGFKIGPDIKIQRIYCTKAKI